jgi:hypothetical protein
MVTRALHAFGPNPPEDPNGLPTFAPCYLGLMLCIPYHAGLFLSVQTGYSLLRPFAFFMITSQACISVHVY